MIARDGIPIIIITAVLFIIILVLSINIDSRFLEILSIVLGSILLFHFFFFRDPNRKIPDNSKAILSPADGRIVVVEEVEENEFLKERSWKISIFLSVFNVHVNRMPVGGSVDYLTYKKGEFLAAFNQRASELNEQTVIGVQNENGKILFKQIAGLIARRIIYNCTTGDQVETGERFGLIRYGSRVDIFLPLSAKVLVSRKDKVKGGISLLGEFE